MSMPFRVSAVSMILMAALTACGGGGGGGSVVREAPSEVAFSSFSAIAPNQTMVMSGLSQTGSGTDAAFNLDPIGESNNTARLTYDAAGNLSALSISTPRSSVSFGAGDVINCSSGSGCGAANATSIAALVNPYAFGWDYQSYGVWMNHVSPTSFQAGAISAGAVTPASAVPTVSSATFSGHAGGFYFDGAGARFATDAQMSAVTNFENRSIQFSTSGTLLTDLSMPHNGATPNSGLNLSGTLNYAPGANQFSGDVKTQNLELTGNASGRFYGPNAPEIGGTYGLGSTDGKRMLGGFGGKR